MDVAEGHESDEDTDSELEDTYPIFAASDYYPDAQIIEFLIFQQRLAALAWMRRQMNGSIDSELAELREIRHSGEHRVSGWETESDQVLNESLHLLDRDARGISSGVILVAAVAALESLMNQLLDQPNDERLRRAGLTRKAETLAERWIGEDKADVFNEHLKWLRDRRNSFAHRLLDDVDPYWEADGPQWTLDDEVADEALYRAGSIAIMLEQAKLEKS
ncbi:MULTISPECIES: hypothetical protein [unclassified Streptomyces]|uniref:hypothetical protein n=1 Tax=unclassified Streptomyces TaxID=2593676 RepID=UPI00036D4EE3|nr:MULTISPECIES: hypothetical protein [unclassified Streptomyces]MYT30468.1 hypothetical protein [Streptomyces sp. SID8354]